MIKVLITGGRGFIGRNLSAHLHARSDCEVLLFDKDNSRSDLEMWLGASDVVFHFAGVNRTKDPSEYDTGNAAFTEEICGILSRVGRAPKIVFASSIQADLDNPYGISKRKAEQTLANFAEQHQSQIRIFRLKNLFGKWCRPNYNSVTATFCHNIANDLPIVISDAHCEIDLSYIDDVVSAFLAELDDHVLPRDIPSTRISLGELAGRIQAFHEFRETLRVPDFADVFNRVLYATYLSYVPPAARITTLNTRRDSRGTLFEFLKSPHSGQVFVSSTKPGVIRGNHYHHTKTEKFIVVKGEALIRMRHIAEPSIQEYAVGGDTYQVIDIPPGYTHSIENIGKGDLITLFWSSEIFDPDRPDTYFLPVLENSSISNQVTV